MKNILPFPVIPNYALFHEELEQEASIWKAILYERQYGPVAIKVARCFHELDPVIFAPVIRAVAMEDADAAYMAMDDRSLLKCANMGLKGCGRKCFFQWTGKTDCN